MVFLPVSQLRGLVMPRRRSSIRQGTRSDQASAAQAAERGAGPDPTTSVYFVSSFSAPTACRSLATGLINSNGAIVGGGAAVDTMAHELGHNLGLLHTDVLNSDGSESAGAQVNNNNLMQSLFRMVPTSASDTRIGSTIDLLTSGQGTQVRNQLFTAGLLDVTVGRPGPGWCTSLVAGCIFGISASSGGGAPGESLTGMKLRFLHASDLADFDSTAMSVNCSVSSSALPLSGGGVELDYAFPTGCIAAGDHSHFSLDYPEDPSATCGLCGRPTIYTPPFSVELDYATGFTSTALATRPGNFIASNPVELGFVNSDYGLRDVPFDPTGFDIDSHAAPASVAEPGSASAARWDRRLILGFVPPLALTITRHGLPCISISTPRQSARRSLCCCRALRWQHRIFSREDALAIAFRRGVKLPWPAENASLRAGSRQASDRAFADHRAVEIGKRPDHPHHHTPSRSGRVDALNNRPERGARFCHTHYDLQHVLQRVRQPIELPNNNSVALMETFQQPMQFRPIPATAGGHVLKNAPTACSKKRLGLTTIHLIVAWGHAGVAKHSCSLVRRPFHGMFRIAETEKHATPASDIRASSSRQEKFRLRRQETTQRFPGSS
jgi:hypothetical protein